MSSTAPAGSPILQNSKTQQKEVKKKKKRKKVVIGAGEAVGGSLILSEGTVEILGGIATSVQTSAKAIKDVMITAGITKITGGGAEAEGAALFLKGKMTEAGAPGDDTAETNSKPKPAIDGGTALAGTFEFTLESFNLGRPTATAPKPCDDDINQIKKTLNVTNIRAGGARAAGPKVESDVFASDSSCDEDEDKMTSHEQV